MADRTQRRDYLTFLTTLLKNYRGVRRAIGIATEAGMAHGRSYDFVHVEGEPISNSEVQALGLKVFGGDGGRLMDKSNLDIAERPKFFPS